MVTLDGRGDISGHHASGGGRNHRRNLDLIPLIQWKKMYEEDGILYAVMGQGDDGDYIKDGKLAEALYRSEDGVNFSFVEEIEDDTPEQAG